MLGEARQALLLQRVGSGPAAMTAREALELATRGGARVLGRDDIGALAPGMAADIVAFDLTTSGFAGALARSGRGAGVLRAGARVAWSVINGSVVVRDGRLTALDLEPLLERHNRLARVLVEAGRAQYPLAFAVFFHFSGVFR